MTERWDASYMSNWEFNTLFFWKIQAIFPLGMGPKIALKNPCKLS